jgi:hypothetical protein
VLRSVSTTIGMPGEEIVPPEDQIDRMMQEEQRAKQQGSIDAAVAKAVSSGVEAGVKRITTELTSGILATHAQMPQGNPTHIGTPGDPSFGQGQNHTNNPDMDLGQQQSSPQQPGSMAHGAAQAQGRQPTPLSNSMGPQTHLTGNQPGPHAKPVSGGVG